MIRAELRNKDAVVARFAAYVSVVTRVLVNKVTSLTIQLQSYVKSRKLSGNPLRTRTGNLRRSINQKVEVTQSGISGTVGTNVFYGKIHELGGTFKVKAHERIAKIIQGRKEGKLKIRAHSVTFPERSFLRSSLRENKDRFTKEILSTFGKAVRVR